MGTARGLAGRAGKKPSHFALPPAPHCSTGAGLPTYTPNVSLVNMHFEPNAMQHQVGSSGSVRFRGCSWRIDSSVLRGVRHDEPKSPVYGFGVRGLGFRVSL